MRQQYQWYMAGIVTFVIPMGVHTVLFPWLIVVQLQESVERLGLAQMATQLPGLVLILFGGLLADRIDARKILITVHLLASLPAFVLAFMLSTKSISFESLIIYGLFMGSMSAFAQPARDGMLNLSLIHI